MTSIGRRVRRSVVIGGMVDGVNPPRLAKETCVCGFLAEHLLHDSGDVHGLVVLQRVDPSSIPFVTNLVGWSELSGGCFFCACATFRNRQRWLICVVIIIIIRPRRPRPTANLPRHLFSPIRLTPPVTSPVVAGPCKDLSCTVRRFSTISAGISQYLNASSRHRPSHLNLSSCHAAGLLTALGRRAQLILNLVHVHVYTSACMA